MVQTFSTWLHSTRLSWAMAGGVPWLWPMCETLHFIGLALLMGIVSVLDLRMLGMAKELPLGPLQRLMPFAILGFTINLVTGLLFFTGDPTQYIHNVAFGFKLLFIGLAGVNSSLKPNATLWMYCVGRSEEHTSELQSRSDLVCRLLLEKKNSDI